MDLFAIDDSAQEKPTRDGMGPLVAVGGLHVPGDAVRALEVALDGLCAEVGFPPGDEFKWSPPRDSWQRDELVGVAREQFHLQAIGLARSVGATAIVVIEDKTKRRAATETETAAEDVVLLFLERAQLQVPAGRHAVVVFDRPGGNRRTENDFLSSTLTRLRIGTAYTELNRLALALSTDSKLSRLLQLADVVTACTTSYVAGESRHSPPVFCGGVLPLLRTEAGRRGGCGLKIHPDRRYGNLYHWLLGDEMFVRADVNARLPSKRFSCYRTSSEVA